jgi:hypothetical protein
MLIGVEGFGSIWVRKPGPDRWHDAYLNTTGVPCRGRLRYRTRVSGMVRYHCIGGFNPQSISRNCGRVFECRKGMQEVQGSRRLLLDRTVPRADRVDAFLMATSSRDVDRTDWESPTSRSATATLVALSEFAGEQEALWLMTPYSWIRTSRGVFLAKVRRHAPLRASLELVSSDGWPGRDSA